MNIIVAAPVSMVAKSNAPMLKRSWVWLIGILTPLSLMFVNDIIRVPDLHDRFEAGRPSKPAS